MSVSDAGLRFGMNGRTHPGYTYCGLPARAKELSQPADAAADSCEEPF